MGIGDWQAIATVSAFVAFMAICWWAYSPANKQRFDADAKLVLDDEPAVSDAPGATSEKRK